MRSYIIDKDLYNINDNLSIITMWIDNVGHCHFKIVGKKGDIID